MFLLKLFSHFKNYFQRTFFLPVFSLLLALVPIATVSSQNPIIYYFTDANETSFTPIDPSDFHSNSLQQFGFVRGLIAPLGSLYIDEVQQDFPIPDLAKTPVPILMTDSNSGDKFTEIDLKEGLVWSDGKPFTADDVVFSYHICTLLGEGFFSEPCGNLLNLITGIEKINSHKVKITFNQDLDNYFDYDSFLTMSFFNYEIMQLALKLNFIVQKAFWEPILNQFDVNDPNFPDTFASQVNIFDDPRIGAYTFDSSTQTKIVNPLYHRTGNIVTLLDNATYLECYPDNESNNVLIKWKAFPGKIPDSKVSHQPCKINTHDKKVLTQYTVGPFFDERHVWMQPDDIRDAFDNKQILHIFTGNNLETTEELREDPTLGEQSKTIDSVNFIGINNPIYPFNIREVRVALATIVDREAVSEAFAESTGGVPRQPAYSIAPFLPYASLKVDPSTDYPGQRGKLKKRVSNAVKLLASAGFFWKDEEGTTTKEDSSVKPDGIRTDLTILEPDGNPIIRERFKFENGDYVYDENGIPEIEQLPALEIIYGSGVFTTSVSSIIDDMKLLGFDVVGKLVPSTFSLRSGIDTDPENLAATGKPSPLGPCGFYRPYDMSIDGWGWSIPIDSNGFNELYGNCDTTTQDFNNAAFNALVESAKSCSTLAECTDIVIGMQDILRTESPSIPLIYGNFVNFWHKDVYSIPILENSLPGLNNLNFRNTGEVFESIAPADTEGQQ